MQLIAGKILTPVAASSFLPVPHRILHIDACQCCVWCIALPHSRKGRPAGYVPGPIALHMNVILAAIEAGEIVQAAYRPPDHWAMKDADYLAGHLSGKELARRAHRIQRRKQAWTIVAEIVKNHSLIDLLHDTALKRSLILQRARECNRTLPTVYRLLHSLLGEWFGRQRIDAPHEPVRRTWYGATFVPSHGTTAEAAGHRARCPASAHFDRNRQETDRGRICANWPRTHQKLCVRPNEQRFLLRCGGRLGR